MPTVARRTNDQWLADLEPTSASHHEACEALHALLVKRLRRALRDRGVATADIEDFAQEAFVKVIASREGFRGDSKFETWATVIAIRVAYTELRRARWKDHNLDELAADRWLPDPAPPADDHIERRSLVETMRRIIEEQLTPRQRISILAKLEDVPQVTLAERLGTNINALHKLQHDARRKLRKGILEAGFSEVDVRRIIDVGAGE